VQFVQVITAKNNMTNRSFIGKVPVNGGRDGRNLHGSFAGLQALFDQFAMPHEGKQGRSP